jgi:hypothetical protein
VYELCSPVLCAAAIAQAQTSKISSKRFHVRFIEYGITNTRSHGLNAAPSQVNMEGPSHTQSVVRTVRRRMELSMFSVYDHNSHDVCDTVVICPRE